MSVIELKLFIFFKILSVFQNSEKSVSFFAIRIILKPEKFPLLDFKQANPAQSAFNIIKKLLFSEQAIG